MADLGARLLPARAALTPSSARAPGGLLSLRGGSALDKGASRPHGHPGGHSGPRRQRGRPEAPLVPTVDRACPGGADGPAMGRSLLADARARGQRERQRLARFDGVPQPFPTPPVPSFRGRTGRIPALDVVARPGRRVVAAHARSSGLSTGPRLDGRLPSPPVPQRLSTLALHASPLSAVRTFHSSVSDHGGLARPLPALDPRHDTRRRDRHSAGRGRMASAYPADLDAPLRLRQVVGGGGPRRAGPGGFRDRPVVAPRPSVAESGRLMDGRDPGPCPPPGVWDLLRGPRIELFDPGVRRWRPRFPGGRWADHGVP